MTPEVIAAAVIAFFVGAFLMGIFCARHEEKEAIEALKEERLRKLERICRIEEFK